MHSHTCSHWLGAMPGLVRCFRSARCGVLGVGPGVTVLGLSSFSRCYSDAKGPAAPPLRRRWSGDGNGGTAALAPHCTAPLPAPEAEGRSRGAPGGTGGAEGSRGGPGLPRGLRHPRPSAAPLPPPPAGGGLPGGHLPPQTTPGARSPPLPQGALRSAGADSGAALAADNIGGRRKMAEEASVCSFVFKKRGLAAGRGRRKRPSSDQEQGEGWGIQGRALGAEMWPCPGEARKGLVPSPPPPPHPGVRVVRGDNGEVLEVLEGAERRRRGW